jgi:hypothetical protein
MRICIVIVLAVSTIGCATAETGRPGSDPAAENPPPHACRR